MPGKTLNVSVRSTGPGSDAISIGRDDADLLLSANTPIVLAIVRRAPIGRALDPLKELVLLGLYQHMKVSLIGM